MTLYQALAILIIIIIVVLAIFIYRQIMWSKIDKPYVNGEFKEALRRIKLYSKWLPLSHQKQIVYTTSIATYNKLDALLRK